MRQSMFARSNLLGCMSILISGGASGLGVSADRPWLQALEAEEEFEIVSVVSHVDSLTLARTNLMSDFPLKVKMLGFTGAKPKEWTNLKRVKLLHNHVVDLPPDKIVFVLDFFDVAWLAGLCCHTSTTRRPRALQSRPPLRTPLAQR